MPRKRISTDARELNDGLGTSWTDMAICDDCGGPAQIVISDMLARECDILCWGCLMKRAVNVAAAIIPEDAAATEVVETQP